MQYQPRILDQSLSNYLTNTRPMDATRGAHSFKLKILGTSLLAASPFYPFLQLFLPSSAPAPALPDFTAELAKPAMPAVVLRYAQPTFVNQVFPTLAMLPRIIAGVAEPAPCAQPLRYDRGSFAAPDKFGLAAPAAVFVSSWRQPEPPPTVQPKYAAGDVFSAPAKTLPPAAVTLSHWSPTIGPAAQPQSYGRGSFAAPDKFNIITLALAFVSSWRQPEPPPTVQPKFAAGDVFSAPAKTLPPAAVTLSHWSPTIGPAAQPQSYGRGSFAAPDKFNIAAPAIVFVSSWAQPEPRPSAAPKFAQPAASAGPERSLPAIASSVAAWTATQARPAVNRFWSRPEALNEPVFITLLTGPFVGVERGFAVLQSLEASQAVTLDTLAAKTDTAIQGMAAGQATTLSGLAAKGATTFSAMAASGFTIIVRE